MKRAVQWNEIRQKPIWLSCTMVPGIPLRCTDAPDGNVNTKCLFPASLLLNSLEVLEENKHWTCLSGVESIWFEEHDIISQQTWTSLKHSCWKTWLEYCQPGPEGKGHAMQVKRLSSFLVWAWAERLPACSDHMCWFPGPRPALGN